MPSTGYLIEKGAPVGPQREPVAVVGRDAVVEQQLMLQFDEQNELALCFAATSGSRRTP